MAPECIQNSGSLSLLFRKHCRQRKVMIIDLWVNFTNKTANNAYVTMISKSDSASPNLGWMLRVKGQGSNFKFAFSGSINGTTAPVEIISNSVNITLNTYYHLAMTWSKRTVKFYLNGTEH